MRVARPCSGSGSRRRFALPAVAIALGVWSSSCSPVGFASDALVASVRVFAASADKPYARPGDTVTMSVLAFDGRSPSLRTGTMGVEWLQFDCTDPVDDAYYNCFAQANLGSIPGGGVPVPPGGDDAGAVDGGGGSDGGGADGQAPSVACSGLDPEAGVPLPVVSTLQFRVPSDSVSRHPPVAGTIAPYGLEILFNAACAGHVEMVPLDPKNANPQQVPIACVDDNGQRQGPDDYVFGFTRVYTYEADSGITNTNPVVSGVDFPDPPPVTGWPSCFQGQSPSFSTGVLYAPLCQAGTKTCSGVKLGPLVPPSSQEIDPQNGRRELLWVDYYSTFGGFSSSAKLLYDPSGADLGGPNKTDTVFHPPIVGPGDPVDGYIFMVVHDNRGGASWVTVPVHLQ